MVTWNELAAVIEVAQEALHTVALDFFPTEKDFTTVRSYVLSDTADAACRYYAQNNEWPTELLPEERHAIAQRLLLAYIIIRTMQVSIRTEAGKITPDNVEPKMVLEWLLVWAWKAGGPRLMPNYRHLLFTALDYASATKQFRVA